MKISKTFRFEASHILPKHPGKCSRLHGHSYQVQVTVLGSVHPATGFVIDFAEIKKIVQPLVDKLDHQHLNRFMSYPSAENIATWFGRQIHAELMDSVLYGTGTMVKVCETADTTAVWHSREFNDVRGDNGWQKLSDGNSEELDKLIRALEKFGR